ncbi:MAG: hypothetical protein ABIH23_20285 [bacterium]
MKRSNKGGKPQEEKTVIEKADSPTVGIDKAERQSQVDSAPTTSIVIATSDCWRYHTEHAPRKFIKGEVIPEGWSTKNCGWRNTADGKWSKQ